MNNWNDIRSAWVCGNNSHVIAALNKLNKKKIIQIMHQAITDHYESLDLKKGCYNGTIIDLIEILNRLNTRGI